MYARRILAAAAIAIATASGAACGGNSPTAASNNLTDDRTPRLPDVPPTDTAGFIAPSMMP